jgi:hypothetical protein
VPLLVVGAAATLGYWGVYYAIWLRPNERTFFRQLLQRRR